MRAIQSVGGRYAEISRETTYPHNPETQLASSDAVVINQRSLVFLFQSIFASDAEPTIAAISMAMASI